MKVRKNETGFGAVGTLLIIGVIVCLGLITYAMLHHESSSKPLTETQRQVHPSDKKSVKSDPYEGWKLMSSARAGFSIKYPSTWTSGDTLGKDNVEHISLKSNSFELSIDSYLGQDPTNGGQVGSSCPDCMQTLSSTTFNAAKVDKVNLDTITYKLDSGVGNALILELPNSTYYIPSPAKSGVVTSFRGISVLPSLQSYQHESAETFAANADYKTAQLILESLSY